MSQLTPDQMNELQCCFQTFDQEGKGMLTPQECAMAMRSLGYDLPDNQFGQCSLQQFQGLAAQHIVVVDSYQKLEQALLCFDTQGQGWVQLQQLQYVLTNYGQRFSPQEWQAFQSDANPQQGLLNARAAAARFTFKS